MNLPTAADNKTTRSADQPWTDDALQKAHERALKEKPALREGFPLVPIFLIFIAAGLLFWAGIYIAHNTGRFDPLAYDPHPPKKEVRELSPEERLQSTLAKGSRLYKKNCQQCHQAQGQGIPGVYPPLAGSPWVLGNPERAAAIVIGGLVGRINVLGKEYNNAMASLSQLSDKDIAAVLTYIRMNESWNLRDTAVSPEQVAAVRRQWGNRSTSWTVEEILAKYPLEEKSAP